MRTIHQRSWSEARRNPSAGERGAVRAFSMIELLVVLGIMTLLSAVSIPAVSYLGASSAFRSSVGEAGDLLEEAYAAALAKNTYVWVGFSPMAGNSGGLGVVVMYSPHQDPSDLANNNVSLLAKPVILPGLSLATISASQISDPRRATASVGQITSADLEAFSARIAGAIQAMPYVLEIAPSGQVSISSSGRYAAIEVGLAPAKGNVKDVAVVQMNAFTGRVATYQP